MRIFAKIRQVYDRLCGRIEASADRMRQEREHLSEQDDEAPNTRRRQIDVERDFARSRIQAEKQVGLGGGPF
jgi:hypothetical protein